MLRPESERAGRIDIHGEIVQEEDPVGVTQHTVGDGLVDRNVRFPETQLKGKESVIEDLKNWPPCTLVLPVRGVRVAQASDRYGLA